MIRSGHLADSLNSDAVARLYGAQSALAAANFAGPGPTLADLPDLVAALVQVKIAAARVNARWGLLETGVADAIGAAGEELLAGEHLEQFVVPMLQGGGGTSTNMNVNEVLAALAAERAGIEVHPNDHVNRHQSTNDVIPTAVALAVHAGTQRADGAFASVSDALRLKAAQYPELEHLGRSCVQDAVPISVRDLHEAQAHAIDAARSDLTTAVGAILAVPLGGTVVGTGLGAPNDYHDAVVTELAGLTGTPVTCSPNRSYSISSLEPLVRVVEALDHVGRALARVASDLRLLASGPHGGIGEVVLPAAQAGSSIMPGKINPVIPEFVMQASFALSGRADTARMAAAAGELEVTAMSPVVVLDVLTGLDTAGAAARSFAERCIAGVVWNEARVAANLRGSFGGAVLRAGQEGYDAVADDVSTSAPRTDRT